MIKIKCLGGFREVGRNAVQIEYEGERLLFDYGMKVEFGTIPLPANPDHTFIAHAHLDHIGAAPVLFKKKSRPIYATPATFELGNLVLKDSMKVARIKGRPEIFSMRELMKMEKNKNIITYGQIIETRKAEIEVISAGHIPGSSMFIINIGGKRILYTSDFNTLDTRLLKGADIKKIKDIDILFTESTYASRDHTDRRENEKKLWEIVSETISEGGVAIIPVFAIGRAAEIIMILKSFNPKFPIYLDGMAKDATEITLRYPEMLRDPKKLEEAYRYVIPLYTDEERKAAIKEPCVIVTTGGCIDGGPAVFYIKHLYTRPECSLTFTGFQIPKTAGRYLLETGRYVTEGIDLAVKMKINYLDFSAHVGRTGLFEFVKKLRPEKVVCMHGDYPERFATELRGRFQVDAIAPKNGDELKI